MIITITISIWKIGIYVFWWNLCECRLFIYFLHEFAPEFLHCKYLMITSTKWTTKIMEKIARKISIELKVRAHTHPHTHTQTANGCMENCNSAKPKEFRASSNVWYVKNAFLFAINFRWQEKRERERVCALKVLEIWWMLRWKHSKVTQTPLKMTSSIKMR